MCRPCSTIMQPEAHSYLSSADVETSRAQLAAVLQQNVSLSEENNQLSEENSRLQAKLERKDKQLAEALRGRLRAKGSGKRSENAPPVIRKIYKPGTEADPLSGPFAVTIDGWPAVTEYEPHANLRDAEQIPLLEGGRIRSFPATRGAAVCPDSWYQPNAVKICYEISFTRFFYRPEPLRSLQETHADILALETETEGMLYEIIKGIRP